MSRRSTVATDSCRQASWSSAAVAEGFAEKRLLVERQVVEDSAGSAAFCSQIASAVNTQGNRLGYSSSNG